MTQNSRVWMQKKFWGRRYSTRWHFPQTIEDNQPFLILDLVCLLLSLWHSGIHLKYQFLFNHILNFSLQSLLVTWQKSFGLKMIDSDRFHADIGIASNFCNGVLIIKLHRPWPWLEYLRHREYFGGCCLIGLATRGAQSPSQSVSAWEWRLYLCCSFLVG